MREFRRGPKEDLGRLVVRGIGAVLLLAVTVMLMRGAWGMYVKMAEASQAQEEAEVELARARAQAQGVGGSLDELSSERGQEEQIRQRFGVAKPGEGEIDIIHDQSTSTAQDTASEGWWQRLWRSIVVW